MRRVLAFARKNPETLVAGRKPGSGRPAVIDENIQRVMKRKLLLSPTTTAKQMKKAIPGLANVTVRAIQHVSLKKLKLPSRVMAKKPLLTKRMKEQRLEFANQYGHWGVDDWKKVMFSDESHFELRFGHQGSRCRRPMGSDRFEERFTKKMVKHPPKVMAWACFSWKGRGALEFLDQGEMMNGQRYRRLLDEKLELFMHQHETNHFLQDGAPCHKAKIVTQWFKERPNIKLIKWPGNSPDLNPNENVWAWMKLQLRETSCTNMKEWKEEIVKLWVTRMSDSDYLKKLVESMPRRLAEVIEKDGATTGY